MIRCHHSARLPKATTAATDQLLRCGCQRRLETLGKIADQWFCQVYVRLRSIDSNTGLCYVSDTERWISIPGQLQPLFAGNGLINRNHLYTLEDRRPRTGEDPRHRLQVEGLDRRICHKFTCHLPAPLLTTLSCTPEVGAALLYTKATYQPNRGATSHWLR